MMRVRPARLCWAVAAAAVVPEMMCRSFAASACLASILGATNTWPPVDRWVRVGIARAVLPRHEGGAVWCLSPAGPGTQGNNEPL